MPPPTWEFAPAPHGHSGEQAGAASPGALSSPGSQGGGSPKQDGGGLSARSLKALSAQEQQAHLRVLEDEVRNKLWAMADFNGGEVRLLQRAFRKVDTSWPQGCVALYLNSDSFQHIFFNQNSGSSWRQTKKTFVAVEPSLEGVSGAKSMNKL